MSNFIDQYLPGEVPGYPCQSSPRFSTSIQITAGGNEHRNQEWEHPLHRYVMPEAAREWYVVAAVRDHWMVTGGPFSTFPWSDRMDFASCELAAPNLEPIVSFHDQSLGTGDGFTDTFQLVKRYTRGGTTYVRTIHLPVLSSIVIAKDGVLVDPANYTVSRPGGEVQFDLPPSNGAVLTAGFLFDVEVRFESDDAFDGIIQTYQVGGFADITLVEVRPC